MDLGAGLPDHLPSVTIDRQCGSSQQAVHFAAQAVMSGTQDVVRAGGVQNIVHARRDMREMPLERYLQPRSIRNV